MEKILTLFLFFFLVGNVEAQSIVAPIRVPLYSSTISLNPAGIQDQSSLWVSRQVNCQLIRSQGGVLSMEAAESIQYLDQKTLLVTLRKNAVFHDKSPVTSDDIIETFEYLRKNRNLFRSIFEWVNHIEKVDAKRLKFVLTKPNSQFLNVLAAPNYAIFKKSFIKAASIDQSLWEQPLGCGVYQISRFDLENHFVELISNIPNLLPIRFDLLGENQITYEQMKAYDIIGLTIARDDYDITDYRVEKIFDPYHIFLGLNTRLPEWQSRENRCALFSQFERNQLLNAYGEDAEAATDILPRGVLGFQSGIDYPDHLKKQAHANYIAPKDDFCISTLSVSIPLKYRPDYSNMVKPFFANIQQRSIDNPKEFGKTFSESNCDALVLGLKSNVLDGYEYLITLADNNDKVNFTGYIDKKIQEKIKSSQDMYDNRLKSIAYQEISESIRNECLYYPILTIPMKKVYVKKNRLTPGLGETPLNEYFLGQVK